MSTVKDLQLKLQKLQGQETKLAIEAIMQNLDIAADLIARQLSQGIMKDGKKSDYPYSPFTIAVKRGKSGIAGITSHLTNYDTGESYRQLYAKVKGFLIEFGTTTDKEEAISARMEGKAFGLSPDSGEEWIRQFVQKSFNQIVQEFLK